MRSASCGVVTEPSTSDRSYGPLTIALDASTKYAICIASATASNSSSQSSRLNWQPSHEANFHTASFLRLRAISRHYVSVGETVREGVDSTITPSLTVSPTDTRFQISRLLSHGLTRSKRKTGPSLQMKVGPNWQCPQNPTAHFILRSIEMKMFSSLTPRF